MRHRGFEVWFARRIGLSLRKVQEMWDGETYTSREYLVEIAWAAWCGALGFDTESKD